MSIVLFEEITSESALCQLEANGEKYTGLYVDMNNKDERKYVKDQAALIKDMLKRLDRARIDKSKEYKARVECEAKSIRERLEAANKPFTDLIDAHTAERKKILDAEKAKREAEELAKQIESDHEIGLLLNDKFDSEKEQREADRLAAQKAHDEQVAREAVERERKKEEERIKREESERLERERNIEHKRSINQDAVNALMKEAMLDKQHAQHVVSAIYEGVIPNVSISY